MKSPGIRPVRPGPFFVSGSRSHRFTAAAVYRPAAADRASVGDAHGHGIAPDLTAKKYIAAHLV